MGRKIGQKIIGNVIILLVGVLVGFTALLLVFCLPVEPMQIHVQQSLPMIEQEFVSSTVIEGYPATLTGNFTDCLMLEHAVYENDEHSLFSQVLYMYRGEISNGEGWAPGYSLAYYLQFFTQTREVEYARYWHGYLVVLKPLLLLTTFNSIRMLASIIQLILVGVLIMAYTKRGDTFLGFALLVSMPFLYFFSLYYSLSLSICFYLMTVILLVQQKWHEKLLSRHLYCEFFLIAGMATAYFDFLTYPLVTLGFPLVVALYWEDSGWKKMLGKLVGYSAEWAVGYLGFWACKWVLTDILTGGNIIQDAFHTLSVRTDVAWSRSFIGGFVYVLQQNVSVYLNWPFVLLILGITVSLFVFLWKRKSILKGSAGWKEALVIGGAALFPLGWFMLTQNHSEQHWMYTHKIFSVTVFAAICFVGKWVKGRTTSDDSN